MTESYILIGNINSLYRGFRGTCKDNITNVKQNKNMLYKVVEGTYSDKGDADNKIKVLLKLNIDTSLDIFEKDNKKYYRVIVGSYNTKENAIERMYNLIEKGYDPFVEIYKKVIIF